MSRLYLVGNSDTKKGFSSTGNKTILGELLWGSKYNPKRVLAFEVTWAEGAEIPEISIDIGENVQEIITKGGVSL